VKRREMMMLRVGNSEGPFLSSPEEKSRRRRVGKRVLCREERWVRAREVVKRALRQVRVWWRRVSSCSSLSGVSVSLRRGKK